MNWTETIALAAPLVAKFVTDAARKYLLPNINRWQIQLLAIGLGAAGAWVSKYITGHALTPEMIAALGLASVAINELGNTIRPPDAGLKPGDNAGVLPGGVQKP